MQKIRNFVFKKGMLLAFAVTMAVVVFSTSSAVAQTPSNSGSEPNASALLEKHAALTERLAQNQFRRPLYLESLEGADKVSSTAYAVLDSPFTTVSATFKSSSRWCEMLILHINTKYCHANADANPSTLTAYIGKKTPQSLGEAFLLEFSYRVTAASSSYLAVQLHADKGPLSTTNYRIELQAVPLPQGKTFIYLRYSYGYGLAGRLAMQTYLATIGRGKVGFTTSDAKSGYVGGMRGTVERNTMRYYLAIEAYLSSLKQPPAQQLNTRLEYWFDATEEYSQQLHEVDRTSYLAMKKDEYQRQQASVVTAE